MHKYICTKCDNLLCETSICPVCNGRTELNSTEVFYCKKLIIHALFAVRIVKK